MVDCDSNFVVNEDTLIQILLWLPVVSLLRFKSVCKSWRTIIQNPFFIHSHATFPSTTTTTTTTNQLGLGGFPLFYRISCERPINIFTVSGGGDEFEVFEDLGTPPPPYYNRQQDDSHFKGLGIPPPPIWTKKYVYYPFTSVTVVGCSNGIICLHNGGSCNDITLWNPATKQCRFLPTPFPLEEEEGKQRRRDYYYNNDDNDDDVTDFVSYFVGFGFDVKTKDYKVLQITSSFKPDKEEEEEDQNVDDDQYMEYGYARQVQVYSLFTDSWKRCKDISLSNLIMHGDYWNQGHYVNGTYLFIAGYLLYEEEGQEATNSRRKCFKLVIMSFDFTEESFRTIQFPFIENKSTTGGHKYLLLFGEKIAFTNACEAPFANGSYCEYLDIWVLNDYGGNESWSKFYTFTSNGRPKFITDNGEFILLDGAKHLQLLNLVTGEIKDLQCDRQGSSRRDGVHISRVGVYKPSLVPIAGYGATDN